MSSLRRRRDVHVHLGDLAAEIGEECRRLDRSPSWVLQRAWQIAREQIRKIPDPEEMS